MRKVLIAAAAAAVFLAACGNNDNGSSDGVPLSTSADVQRELSNFFAGIQSFGPEQISEALGTVRPTQQTDISALALSRRLAQR